VLTVRLGFSVTHQQLKK